MGQKLMFHEGIFKSATYIIDMVRPQIEEFIEKNNNNENGVGPKVKKIVFTGHSLGGGCAQICGLLYRQYIFNNKKFNLEGIVGAVQESVTKNEELSDTWSKLVSFSPFSQQNKLYKDVEIDVFAYAAPPVVNKSEKLEQAADSKNNNKSYLEDCLNKAIEEIKDNIGLKDTEDHFVDFSKISGLKVYNFQLERDLVCYMSVGNYIRLILAMKKITDLNWSRLHKLRYIFAMRKMAEGDNKIAQIIEEIIESAQGQEQDGKVSMDYPDLSQERISLSPRQYTQMLQHIYINESSLSAAQPYFFRLQPSDDSKKFDPYTDPGVADSYKCLKIAGDMGTEVLPIGWHNSAVGHIKTHGKHRYQEAFSKLQV